MLYGTLIYFLNENLCLFENLHSLPRKTLCTTHIHFLFVTTGKKFHPPKKPLLPYNKCSRLKLQKIKQLPFQIALTILDTQTITIMKYENTIDSRVTEPCWSEGWKNPTIHLPTHFGLQVVQSRDKPNPETRAKEQQLMCVLQTPN